MSWNTTSFPERVKGYKVKQKNGTLIQVRPQEDSKKEFAVKASMFYSE